MGCKLRTKIDSIKNFTLNKTLRAFPVKVQTAKLIREVRKICITDHNVSATCSFRKRQQGCFKREWNFSALGDNNVKALSRNVWKNWIAEFVPSSVADFQETVISTDDFARCIEYCHGCNEMLKIMAWHRCEITLTFKKSFFLLVQLR